MVMLTVRTRAGWFSSEAKTVATTELVEFGLVRLRPEGRVRDLLQQSMASILAGLHEDPTALIEAAAFEDRFRQVSVYKDGRIWFSDAVLNFLEVEVDHANLYVQAVGATVEILSSRLRKQRLDEYRHHVLPLSS